MTIQARRSLCVETIVIGTLAGLLGVSPAVAQSSILLGDPSGCRECAIGITSSTRLGGPDDPTGIGMLAEVARDSRGRYAVASPFTIGEIALYDPSGRFVRTIGRRGGGPGEFEAITRPRFGLGDSLHLIQETGRYSVFSPSLEHVRSVTLPSRVFSFALGPAGQIIASSPTASADGQFALQIYSPSGGRLSAFDPVEGTSGAALRRYVASSPEGSVWTLRSDRYEVHAYSASGVLQAVFRAERDWISGEPLPTRLESGTRPPGQMGGVAVDDAGLVWIFAVVPDANWRPLRPEAGPPNPSAIYDTIIEVFDPQSGRIIAHGRMDHMVFPLRPGQVYAVVEQPDGDYRVQIWNVSVPARR